MVVEVDVDDVDVVDVEVVDTVTDVDVDVAEVVVDVEVDVDVVDAIVLPKILLSRMLLFQLSLFTSNCIGFAPGCAECYGIRNAIVPVSTVVVHIPIKRPPAHNVRHRYWWASDAL